MSKHSLKSERLGQEKYNNQGCLMKIISYQDSNHMIVEFQDSYQAKVPAHWCWFVSGEIKNPYAPSIYNMAFSGTKYPICIGAKSTKEYNAWRDMLRRCYDKEYLSLHPTYERAEVCPEWLNYEIFYEWIHSQSNYALWSNNPNWHVDKDIIQKGNKTYCPEKCCLIPQQINKLFVKHDKDRGNHPIGVYWRNDNNCFRAVCADGSGKSISLGQYSTADEAFKAYKCYKEQLIKAIAQQAFLKGEIIEPCYDAMMNYVVEITD